MKDRDKRTFNPKTDGNRFVAQLKEYQVTSQECWRMEDHQDVIKADWNEAGCPPSPKVQRALQAFLNQEPLFWYPDVGATKLRESLATYTGRTAEEVQVFTGSDAALEYFCRAFLNPEDEVIIRTPTYDNFRVYVQSAGAQIVAVNNEDPFKLDHRAVLRAITPKTKMIYLVNPDNPTGVEYDQKVLREVLNAAPHAIVISDEAYFEFNGNTAIPLLDEYPNLIVSRSFSKAFALAGMRVGYLVASPDILAVVNKIRIGKNIGSLAQVAAIAALDDLPYLKKYTADVQVNREWLVAALHKLGFEVQDMRANFIMLKVSNPSSFLSHLRNQMIYIRDRSYMQQLEGYVRITIGTREQVERILTACASYLALEEMISA